MATNATGKVDVVVLSDGSYGFWGRNGLRKHSDQPSELAFLDSNLPGFFNAAQQKCPCDLRINYFVIQYLGDKSPYQSDPSQAHGTHDYSNLKTFKAWPAYLLDMGVAATDLVEKKGVIQEVGGSNVWNGQASNLALAVSDAAKHYDWRPGAARIILVIGDHGWYIGEYSESAEGLKVRQQAIQDAKSNQVAVHTWIVGPDDDDEPAATASATNEYKDVAAQTGATFLSSAMYQADSVVTNFISNLVCQSIPDPHLHRGPGPVIPPRHPHHGQDPHHGHQGGDGSGSLCDQLPCILKTICSMTTLLHKVVDSCYPPSQWPDSPYPDGCGDGCGGKANGKVKRDCGCAGK